MIILFLFSIGLNACEKKSYVFLRKELPVRLANIMKEIALLPDSLSKTPSVKLVSSWYARSFEEVLRYEQLEPTTTNIERYVFSLLNLSLFRFKRTTNHLLVLLFFFLQFLQRIGEDTRPPFGCGANNGSRCYRIKRKSRSNSRTINGTFHTILFGSIIYVTYQYSHAHQSAQQVFPSSVSFILTQTYCQHICAFVAILFGEIPQQGRHIGCIDPVCDPGSVVLDAYENARYLCDQYYLASPELKMTQYNGVDKNAPIRIVYVPSHLYHMLFELFKNSM